MRPRKDRGVALILALLVLAILIVLVGQMVITSVQNRSIAENQLADLQNSYGTRSGYERALLVLQAHLEKEPGVDAPGGTWAQPIELDLGKAHVVVEIRDSGRFLNLSRLVNEKGEVNPTVAAQFRRLTAILGHPPDTAERIIDYIDADSRGEYEQGARNQQLFNLEELLRIQGMPPEALYGGKTGNEEKKGLLSFLTVWPREVPKGPHPPAVAVNFNTAPAEVLLSLSDKMTPLVAQEIVTDRGRTGADGRPDPFRTPDDVKRVSAMSGDIFASLAGQVAVMSPTYEVRVRSRVGNIEKSWLYVVQRPAKPGEGMALLTSQRVNDFLTVRPPAEEGR